MKFLRKIGTKIHLHAALNLQMNLRSFTKSEN